MMSFKIFFFFETMLVKEKFEEQILKALFVSKGCEGGQWMAEAKWVHPYTMLLKPTLPGDIHTEILHLKVTV